MLVSETDLLVARVLDGDLDAYGRLVGLYQTQVWSIVVRMLRDTQSTEDLVQQTFVQAYRQLHLFEPGRDFGIWLKAIARNLVRNEIRRRCRENRHLGHYWETLDHELEREESPTFSREEELRETLAKCMRGLPERLGRIVEMRYHLALEIEVIAHQMGRTVGATRQLLSRARLMLRDCARQAPQNQ
jgi:RNA polymerase sigma-70 factor (ECF subfamily)